MKLPIAKITTLLTAVACLIGSCSAGLSASRASLFCDAEKTSLLSDAKFCEEWRKTNQSTLINILKEARSDKQHFLRSRKAAFKEICLTTRASVPGSETSTIHEIYLQNLVPFIIDIWGIKTENLPKFRDNTSDWPRFREGYKGLMKLKLFFQNEVK